MYAGTQSGILYYSTDNSISWAASTPPAENDAINSVFAIKRYVYIGSANGRVYYSDNHGIIYVGTPEGKGFYSANNGLNWLATPSQPGSGAVNGIFIDGSTIYVGSQNGNIYYSHDNGSSWSLITGPESNQATPVHNIYVVNHPDRYFSQWL